MPGRVQDKVCVVTGAAAGIGRAVAGRLAQEGGRVALADIDVEGAERAAAEIPGSAAFGVDVTDAASVEALYAAVRDRFGAVDVCHNNAGILLPDDTDPPTTDLDVWLGYTLGREGTQPFAVLRDGEVVGSTSYMSLAPEHRRVEIGNTWMNPSTWNTGANVEAKYLLLRHAFEEVGCRRVEFKTDAKNERARRALAAIPAEFEGIHRKHMVVRDGERRDSAWYAVIDDDWPAVKTALERRLETR